MMQRLITGLALGILLAVFPTFVLAQEGTIQGNVTDAQTGESLPGANVLIEELQRGAATGVEGEFEIRNVPAGTHVVTATFVGYQQATTEVEVAAGETTEVTIAMEPDLFGLDEVVVTGVGRGTATKKLGFAVNKVGTDELEQVPATDPGNALRGKIAGVSVVQGSGDPSSAPDIRLRGSTSISGGQQPLIIVDGVITSGSLRDINMEDVESIEVVKGAAASSLYGSLAGNGVVQIRTKRGSGGEPQVVFRSELGISQIAEDYPLATTHPWALDTLSFLLPSGDTRTLVNPSESDFNSLPEGTKITRWDGRSNGEVDADRRFDNPYPVLYDNINNVFTGQPFNTNYVSMSNSGGSYNYFASFENMQQGGVMEPVGSYLRNSFRLNADYTPYDRLNVQFSGSYINVDAPRIAEQGQGDNYFYSVLTSDPYIDMTEENPETGEYSNRPTGYAVQSSNWQNPLYVAQQRQRDENRNRILAGVNVSYQLADWITLTARQSIDRYFTEQETYYPVGYQTPTPNASVNDGYDYRRSIRSSAAITEAEAALSESLGDFNLAATVKYLYEDRDYKWFQTEGSRYRAQGIRDIGSLDPTSLSSGSYQQEERAENYFLDATADYQEKIIVGGLIRRDGSSSFGPDERWQTYYRGSLAYRVTEDFELPNVQELKLRAAYGTSGQRPPFSAQYETYSASATGISPGVLGNNQLKPSTVKELETGLNANFLNRFSLEFNYARTQVEDDYLLVPLSSAAGFSSQWQNIGEIESSAFELALGGFLLDSDDLSWDFNVTWSRVRQEITDIGNRPAFTRSIAGTALNLFRVEEGVSYGAMYGNEILTSLDELTVVDGEVLNAGVDVNGDGVLTRDDYMVNDQGYVVPAGTHGTADEQVVYRVEESGEAAIVQIGDVQPDFQMGFSSTFRFKGFSLYTLLDWNKGGDVYNYTKQLLYFNDRHRDLQDFAAEGYDVNYANGSSAIYNQSNASSYFVEDASYLKLRELSLAYTFDQEQLGPVGQYLDGVRLSVLGRNLLTFTDYTGWDPEVALRTNSTNFRLDEYAYPNYRTFTGSIELRF